MSRFNYVSYHIIHIQILFWMSCFMSLITGLCAVIVLLVDGWPESFGLLVMAGMSVLFGWVSTYFAQIKIEMPAIELRTVLNHRRLPAENFLGVETAWFGLMRMRFANSQSVLFVPNDLFYQDLFSSQRSPLVSKAFRAFDNFLTNAELSSERKAQLSRAENENDS